MWIRNLKKHRRVILLPVILIIIVSLLAAGYSVVRSTLEEPLGPTLPDFGSRVFSPIKPVCGGPAQMVILAVGADNNFGYYRGLADVIRVVRVDFTTQKITVLAFPRALWVSIPGLKERGISEGLANQAYFYGNLYRLPGGGPTLLARTLYENFGLGVDHYVATNMTTFAEAVDALGGVDIHLDDPLYDQIYGHYFPEGWNHLNGKRTLLFARIRSPDSDWRRIDRQTQVLMVLREKILQPEVIPSLPNMVYTFLDNILTDLSRAEIASLICLATKVDREDITTLTVGLDMMSPTINRRGMQVFMPEVDEIKSLVADFMNGFKP
jgi:LCP family protein required for cell wall assembly